MEPSYIAYGNMLGAGLKKKTEDDMKQSLKDQVNNIQICTEVGMMPERKRQVYPG